MITYIRAMVSIKFQHSRIVVLWAKDERGILGIFLGSREIFDNGSRIITRIKERKSNVKSCKKTQDESK